MTSSLPPSKTRLFGYADSTLLLHHHQLAYLLQWAGRQSIKINPALDQFAALVAALPARAESAGAVGLIYQRQHLTPQNIKYLQGYPCALALRRQLIANHHRGVAGAQL